MEGNGHFGKVPGPVFDFAIPPLTYLLTTIALLFLRLVGYCLKRSEEMTQSVKCIPFISPEKENTLSEFGIVNPIHRVQL